MYIDHSPYSPDLAPSNHFLFLSFKESVWKEEIVERFRTDNNKIQVVQNQISDFFFFVETIKEFETRSAMCAELRVEYMK